MVNDSFIAGMVLGYALGVFLICTLLFGYAMYQRMKQRMTGHEGDDDDNTNEV